ncbi:MAG: hypothetical protein HOP15_00705 [Planctomycetes bacterium]|nr:hypothetical protein [Planctomycetota bacterium]
MALRSRGHPTKVTLRRRGVEHGRFAPSEPTPFAQAHALWESDRPILLAGILAPALPRWRGAIRRTLALFDGLRAGAGAPRLAARSRLRGRTEFFPSGATVDAGDPRELEKVYVDGMRAKRFAARGLYAKLSWIAHDERDASLRIRFSFGSENLRDWKKETRRAPWADRYALALFPEGTAQAENLRLRRAIEALLGRRARFSERIVYNNAPGGGAIFHHDCEPHQHGVVFGQLAGETAWLALPKRELARHMAGFVNTPRARAPALRRLAGTERKALRALDREGDARIAKLLDETPAFTARLVEHGALFHLQAGDALLLPNHAWNDTCWHAVFALGRRASLAHSYGIFAARR